MPLRSGETFAIALCSSLVVHGGVALAFELADLAGKLKQESNTMNVEFDVKKELPPPPVVEEPKPLPPPPVEPELPAPVVEKKVKKVDVVTEERLPPPSELPPTEAPAPGEPPPDDQAPAPEFVYTMPATGTQGTMAVRAGTGPTGKARGVRGGTGTGDGGGGGPPESTGTGPRVVSVAAVKKMPQPKGDVDYIHDANQELYTAEARAAQIEGDVIVRLLIDENGEVKEAKVSKGLGYGIDEKAVAFSKRRLKFEPAIDTDDKPVAVRISWTFHFTLPD